jgi:hypothetical protein
LTWSFAIAVPAAIAGTAWITWRICN